MQDYVYSIFSTCKFADPIVLGKCLERRSQTLYEVRFSVKKTTKKNSVRASSQFALGQ